MLILHLVGVWGYKSDYLLLFAALTPLNLFISLIILWWGQESKNRNWYLFAFFAFIAGMAIEILGVHTGFPFGAYEYGDTLGIKLFSVPIMMGGLWWGMIVAAASLVSNYTKNIAINITVAAAIMLGLDLMIEPIAINYDFWTWAAKEPPITNFLAWAVFSLLLSTVFFLGKVPNKNRLASYWLASQVLFFGLLLIL